MLLFMDANKTPAAETRCKHTNAKVRRVGAFDPAKVSRFVDVCPCGMVRTTNASHTFRVNGEWKKADAFAGMTLVAE